MPASATSHGAYRKVDIETASQGKLIVMLFNGAIQRAEEAKRQLAKGRMQEVHKNLIHAQDIINELRAALDMTTGDIARNLDRIYEYFQHLMIRANVRKEAPPIEECVALMTQMRDTWKEVFEKEEAKRLPGAPPPPINQHGATVINLEG